MKNKNEDNRVSLQRNCSYMITKNFSKNNDLFYFNNFINNPYKLKIIYFHQGIYD